MEEIGILSIRLRKKGFFQQSRPNSFLLLLSMCKLIPQIVLLFTKSIQIGLSNNTKYNFCGG